MITKNYQIILDKMQLEDLNKDYLIILLLFVLSFFIGFLFMNDGLFHHDGVQLARAIENTIDDGALYGTNSNRFGVVLLYSIPYYFYRDSEFVVTFMTVLFGALCIPLLFILIKAMFKRNFIAISTSLLFFFSPLFLSITTQAKSHSVALFFILISLYFFVKKRLLLSSIFFCISLFMRFDNIVYLALFLVIAVYYKYESMIAFFIPIVMLVFLNLNFNWIVINEQDHLVFSFGYLNIGLSYLAYSVSLVCFVLFLFSLCWLWLKNKKLSIFLGLWTFIMFAPFTFTHALAARFLINALIPIYILISYLLLKLKYLYRYVALSMLIIMMFLTIYPVISFRHEYSSGKELGLYLGGFEGPVMLGDYTPFAEYYGNVSSIRINHNYHGTAYTTSTVIKEHDLNYSLEPVGSLLFEDYHHTELWLDLHNETIYKILGG